MIASEKNTCICITLIVRSVGCGFPGIFDLSTFAIKDKSLLDDESRLDNFSMDSTGFSDVICC